MKKLLAITIAIILMMPQQGYALRPMAGRHNTFHNATFSEIANGINISYAGPISEAEKGIIRGLIVENGLVLRGVNVVVDTSERREKNFTRAHWNRESNTLSIVPQRRYLSIKLNLPQELIEAKGISDEDLAYSKDLEERFRNQCLANIHGAIGFINTEAEKGDILPAVAPILNILYISEFIKNTVGSFRQGRLINSNELSEFHLSALRHIFKTEDLKNNIEKIISAIKENKDYNVWFKGAAELLDRLPGDFDIVVCAEEAWEKLSFNRDVREEEKQLLGETERLYNLIGSDVDIERRNLVKRLVDHPDYRCEANKKVKFYVVGIGIGDPCNKKCRHCAARCYSNIITHTDSFKLNADSIHKTLAITTKKTGVCIITGHEPFSDVKQLAYTVRYADMPYVHITTNADFAVDSEEGGYTEGAVGQIWEAFQRNPNQRKEKLCIQISMDKFHQEITREKDGSLRENIAISRVANLFEVISRKFPNIYIGIIGLKSDTDDTFLYLLKELSRRGIYPESEKAARSVHKRVVKNKQTKESIAHYWGDEGHVWFKGKYGTTNLLYRAQPIARIGHAKILNPWEYHRSPLSLRDYMSLDNYPALETQVIYVAADGNIYQGSDFLAVWSAGNIYEDNLEDVIHQLEIDPLARALDNNFGKVVSWAIEIEPGLKERISPNPDGREVITEIFKDPAMRLYLTKRLTWEEWQRGLCPETVVRDLGLNVSLEVLKEEYNSKKFEPAKDKDVVAEPEFNRDIPACEMPDVQDEHMLTAVAISA